jgi:competence protein ComEC
VHVLDVGQGLSTVVETAEHLMVFDLGPRYRSGFETGSRVVLPFLRELGRERVDIAVVSHSDIDHAGGLSGLLERFPRTRVLAGEPRPGQDACIAGEHWEWDGVRFEILHPPAGHDLTGNDASCVIRVANAAGATLLTGDIESRVEEALVRRGSSVRDLALVLAPHHGSATSSSNIFVNASAPKFVVFTAGYRNRYAFPRPAVVERWQAIGAKRLNTAVSGQISFDAAQGESLRLVREYRPESLRFWHSRQ